MIGAEPLTHQQDLGGIGDLRSMVEEPQKRQRRDKPPKRVIERGGEYQTIGSEVGSDAGESNESFWSDVGYPGAAATVLEARSAAAGIATA